MDTVLGVQYKGGVVLATDQINAFSILRYQSNLDKIAQLTSHSAIGVAGPNCDMVNFTEFITRSLKLYEMSKGGVKLSPRAQANFARGELAKAIRRGPYQVNTLLAGYDTKKDEAEMYYLDYMGTLHQVKFGAQGYASNFCSSIFDREYKDGLTKAEAIQIVQNCIKEIHTRFLISQPNFIIKVIDSDGVHTDSFGGDPADT